MRSVRQNYDDQSLGSAALWRREVANAIRVFGFTVPVLITAAQALLLEEASKLIKVKSGDKIVEVPRMRALMRKPLDLGLQGNIAAIRLALVYLSTAYAETQVAHSQEAPLTRTSWPS